MNVSQVITILLDSLRMLMSRKLFWVSFGLSGLIGLIYFSTGLEEDGVSMLFGWKHIENPVINQSTQEGEWFYVTMFTTYITRYWLGGGAILLALISTVSVFPEFTQPGAIEITLSKPISRVKLFVVKYLGCLFFVALQSGLLAVLVFSGIVRELGYWNWSIFWVVPIITFAFSLIHCVQVLVGVITRSSLASLLTGICFWMGVWLTQMTEQTLYLNSYALAADDVEMNWQTGEVVPISESSREDSTGKEMYQIVQRVAAPLPKTRDVVLSLDRLVTFRDSGSVLEQIDLVASVEKNDIQYKTARAERRVQERHSTSYLFLSSLGFELVILGIGCWIFVRRDY